MSDRVLNVEIDGRAVSDAVSPSRAEHFTAMQVRNGTVRGLDLHLARLYAANQEMFGVALDGDGTR